MNKGLPFKNFGVEEGAKAYTNGIEYLLYEVITENF